MMKVLVVDGAPRDRQAIVDALSELENVRVHDAVGDITSALRALVVGRPAIDVVVTGVCLVGGDCFELIEATRRWEPPPSIVVVGQDASREDWRRHLVAGADRFVERDPGLRELRDVVSELATRAPPVENLIRILGGMAAVDPAPVDLAAIVHDCAHMARHSIAPEIHLELTALDEPRLVHGTAARLGQLVLNLVLNAADAMAGRGGRLTIRLDTTLAGGVRLEIGDEGPGDAGGLGLAIARAVAAEHRAVFMLVPRAGGGTSAVVSFPRPGGE